jgi:5-methylcytosine-specific restriction protein A
MTARAPRICSCGSKVSAGALCQCQVRRKRENQRRVDAARGSARERGYDSKWSRESKAFLASLGNPVCACGCGKPADMIDHKVAHKGDKRLFWSRSNWQPMNRRCNSRKAVLTEGAFGRRIST